MSFSSVVSRIAHQSLSAAPSVMPEDCWWERLESNFHKRPEGFELPFRDQWRVSATSATDVVVRTLGATMVSTLAIPPGYHPGKLQRDYEEREFYQQFVDGRDASAFFKRPPHGVVVERRVQPVDAFGEDGIVEHLRFESPFEPNNPRLRKKWSGFKRNRRAHAKYVRHADGPRPTVMFIHGFFADPYWLNELVFAIPAFFHAGCDVLLVTLPFHGRRQERFSPFSGHGFFAHGVSHINEAFAQAVFDFRIYVDFILNNIGAPSIGVTGISLGGYTTALLASVEDRLSFAIPNVPVASLPDLVLEWTPISWLLRGAMAVTDMSIKSLRHMTAAHCPLSWDPILPPERLMIVGGVGDRLAPPKHSRLLWDHWRRCRIHWFPGSHLLHLDQGEYMTEIFGFLDDISFLDRSPDEPRLAG